MTRARVLTRLSQVSPALASGPARLYLPSQPRVKRERGLTSPVGAAHMDWAVWDEAH